jgi:hypothetical protein
LFPTWNRAGATAKQEFLSNHGPVPGPPGCICMYILGLYADIFLRTYIDINNYIYICTYLYITTRDDTCTYSSGIKPAPRYFRLAFLLDCREDIQATPNFHLLDASGNSKMEMRSLFPSIYGQKHIHIIWPTWCLGKWKKGNTIFVFDESQEKTDIYYLVCWMIPEIT